MSPSFDLPGDPGAIRVKAAGLRSHGQSFSAVADGLDAVTTDGWISLAADRFREKFAPEAGRWRDAGHGFVGAAGALETYANTLEAAQATARWARDEYARGEQVTRSARAEYDADVRRGQAEKRESEAAGIPFTLTILPFHDPGAAIRDGAQTAYGQAQEQVRAAGASAASTVRACCQGAPPSRSWWETGLAFVGDIFVGVFEGVEGLVKLAMLPQAILAGLIDDIAALATGRLTVDELAMKYQLKAEDAQAFAQAVWEHPGDVALAIGKGILDWDTWADDPAKAIGHLIPDIVLTIATLGGGAAAAGAERGAVGVARGAEGAAEGLAVLNKLDDLADLGKLGKLDDLTDLGKLGKLDDLGDLSKLGKLDDLGDLSKLDDIHVPKGSDEWAEAVHQAYPDVSPQGAKGLWDYTTNDGYTTMNTALRSPSTMTADDLAVAKERIAMVDRGLTELPAQPGTSFRGTNLPADVVKEYQVGNVVSDKAFLSSSTDVVKAQEFQGSGNALIEIQGTSGREISKLSQFPSESEVLFGHGTKFEVLEVTDMGTYTKYVLKEVP